MPDREPVAIMHAEDFERTGGWRLARRSLGLESFGMNVVEISPGDSIPEHDETERDQEEVFVTLSGTPMLVVEGAEYPMHQGTFARLDPHLRRTIVNTGGEPAMVLICSAPRSSGYVPMEWA